MGIGTFGGTVTDFEATFVDGRLTGSARIASLQTKDENLWRTCCRRTSSTPSAIPRFASPPRRSPSKATRSVRRRNHAQGHHAARHPDGHDHRPRHRSLRNERYGLELETTSTAPSSASPGTHRLPNGTKALSDEVTLKADLSLVRAAVTMQHPRASRGAFAATRTTPLLLRARGGAAPARRRDGALGRAARDPAVRRGRRRRARRREAVATSATRRARPTPS